MGKIKWNIAANMGGRVWANLISLLFIPVYLHFLGIERYGLVGFWITLVNVFSLLDFGLGLTLTREMARLSPEGGNRRLQRDTLRTFEVIYWSLALLFGAALWLAAPLVAGKWLNNATLPCDTLIRSLRIMAAVLVFQFPQALYQGGLMGLQRQVLASGIQAGFSTLRGITISLALWLVSPGLEAFFYSQLAVSLLQIAVTASALWKSLPLPGGGASFRLPVCRSLVGYAFGVSGNSLIGMALSQLDKVILSKLITLEMFGYYTLSWSVASGLWSIIQPFNSALFPRFTQLVEERDTERLAALYHRTCQFVAVVLLPTAATLAFFSREAMLVWTRNPATADNTNLTVTLLVIGTALNGLVSVPGNLQFAAGWPQLMLYTNLAATLLLAPLVWVLAPLYGGVGAAAAWLALNCGYLVSNIPLMHRRLLRGHLWRWYVLDVGRPLLCAALVGWIFRLAAPKGLGAAGMLLVIAGCFCTCLAFCAWQSDHVREYLLQKVRAFSQ
ncbi:oligosaccharide flippase family protein [bacterium]|nr:oligosaccharide flippase family protein [bacterium]